MFVLGLALTVTGVVAIVYGLIRASGHMPESLTRYHPSGRVSWIVGLILVVVGVPLLVVGLP